MSALRQRRYIIVQWRYIILGVMQVVCFDALNSKRLRGGRNIISRIVKNVAE